MSVHKCEETVMTRGGGGSARGEIGDGGFFRKSPFVFHVYSAIPISGILSSSHCISLKDKEFPDKLQRGVKRDI